MAGQDIFNANGLVYQPQGGSQNVSARSDNFGNLGVNEVFGKYTELARNGNLYIATMLNGATPPVSTAGLPTTTGGADLYNAATAGSGIVVIPLWVGVSAKTVPTSTDITIACGVTQGALATPLTANGTNLVTRNTLDSLTSDSTTFYDINKVIVQPTYMLFSNAGALGSKAGYGFSVELGGYNIVKPTFAFDVSVIGDVTGAPTFWTTILYAKIKMDVGTAQ